LTASEEKPRSSISAAIGVETFRVSGFSHASATASRKAREIGARAFCKALPDPTNANALSDTGEVLSFIEAALLRSGWLVEPDALSRPCVVIQAKAATEMV
jgi:hypothetical protein